MLTDLDCKNAKCAADRPRMRLYDAGGLYLEVAPNGSKRWFVKYRFNSKEKRLALGPYPSLGLKAARAESEKARVQRSSGTDPVQARRLTVATKRLASATTFEAVARDYFGTKRSGWSETYAERWLGRLEKDLFPVIGSLPIADINAPVLLDALRRVEKRGAVETAHTLRQTAGQVFAYALQTGRAARNAAADLHGALKPVNVKHMAAVLDPGSVSRLMRAIDTYIGQPVTRAALLLSAMLFQRPGNIRAMEWSEIDFDRAMWTIPSTKMKRKVHGKLNGRPHLVPLAPQALACLKELQPLTGHSHFVFPSLLSAERCMSENTVRAALRRMGFTNDEMTPHGFRAMARTLIVEQFPGINPDVIEAQLAHGKSGPLGMAYDRADYIEQRKQLMRSWADYLDTARAGATVLTFAAKAA
ncbi:MAG: integrase arm-type DNA-binding domain-containing protein [Rubrivivax sp.]|nr:integrase arm-type DNA-binding domain-containing protein [Rubrivivax sp.]MCL4699552.1 integrase arm-type DNA-binding domain-containing protein [Burkholderiaceae bacterium]